MDRLSHTVIGAWQAGAWLVISVAAYYLLKNRHEKFARSSIRIGLSVALVASILQLVTGHSSAEEVAHYQPTKMAAMEGHFAKNAPADLYLMGWVDAKNEKTHGIAIPGGLSWLIHGKTDAPVKGLDNWPKSDRPPVNFTFQTYHAMVAIGMLLILLSVLGVIGLWRGFIFKHRALLTILVFAVILPQLANQLGWFTAEVGRQPWIVYGLLKTSAALSAVVSANEIVFSLILFTIVYLLLFILFIFLLDQKIKHGPDDPTVGEHAPKRDVPDLHFNGDN